MPRLPAVSGRDAIKAFKKNGWVFERQRGSHVILVKEGREEVLSVPLHPIVGRGLLRKLIRAARLSVAEFVDLL